MNKGYEKMMGKIYPNGANNNNTSKVIMNVGPTGSGKSTSCNLLFGTEFETKSSCSDVTKELSPPTTSPKHDDHCIIDTVGFTPNYKNIAKMILLLFHHGYFPDYLLYPAQNDRIVEIISLIRLVKVEILKIMIVPFSSKSYYDTFNVLVKIGYQPEKAKIESINGSFNKDLIEDIKLVVRATSITGNVVPIESMDSIPTINGSMKSGFLNLFFKDNKLNTMTYEEHKNNLGNKNDSISTMALLYDFLIDAANELQTHANLNNQGLIESINECQFLKD